MKKFLLILSAILLLCTVFSPAEKAHAAAEEERQAELDEKIDELLEGLDTEELQKYLSGLEDFKGISVKEKLKQLITGELKLDYSSLFEASLSFLWEEGKAMIPAFALILAVTLLCGLLGSSNNDFLHSTMSDIIYFVAYLSAGGAVLACLIGVLQAGFGAISEMKKQMEIVYPLLLTLMSASGGAVSAGIFRPAVVFLSGALSDLFLSVVLPCSVAVIILAFIGNLSTDVRTEKLGEFFKSVTKWLLGITLTVFSLFLTVQGITAAQYDGISLRAAKYVVSGSVPIVGSFLSGGMELVVAGSALIKNALGSFSIFLLIGTIARPVLLLAAFQLFLRLSAAATEPAGGKISSFLSRLAGDCGYFLAGILCIAFLYFLTLVLLVCSTGVLL